MTGGTRTSPTVVLVHGARADASGSPCADPPPDAGHYGWEEKAEEYRSRIVDWVSGGYKRVAAG